MKQILLSELLILLIIPFIKVVSFALLEDKLSLIYTSGKRLAEFQRVVSRLNEMSSSDEKLGHS